MLFTKSLKGQYLFKVVLRKGQYVSNNNITMYVLNNRKYENSNFLGICVSKKHGNSVVRNRLKRWVREVYKENEKNIKKGYNMIVLFKKNIDVDKLNYNIINDEIGECINKLGVKIESDF